MRVNKINEIRFESFPLAASGSNGNFRNALYRQLFLAVILGSALAAFGCASSSTGDGGKGPSAPAPNGLPELTDEIINERINDARVREVPEENGTGDPIYWSFDQDEPKEITIVEKQVNGSRATLVLDIKTRSAPRTRNPRELAGQIRTEWELRTGWVLRRWEITDTENVSMKYRNLAKTPEHNPNR